MRNDNVTMDGARTAVPVMEVTDMVIRNKEYYSQFDEEMKRAKRTLGYHVRQAERCKRIYQNTRGRFGLWGLLNRWANKQNQYHCEEGSKIANA